MISVNVERPNAPKVTGDHQGAKRRRRAFVSTARLGVRRPCTWALHRHFGPDKADFFVKLHDPISRRAKHPGHSSIITHNCVDQRATNAPASVSFGDYQHRNVAVRHPIGKGTQETNDFATVDRDEGPLRPGYEFAKVRRIRNATGPAACLKQPTRCLNLRGPYIADFHLPDESRSPTGAQRRR